MSLNYKVVSIQNEVSLLGALAHQNQCANMLHTILADVSPIQSVADESLTRLVDTFARFDNPERTAENCKVNNHAVMFSGNTPYEKLQYHLKAIFRTYIELESKNPGQSISFNSIWSLYKKALTNHIVGIEMTTFPFHGVDYSFFDEIDAWVADMDLWARENPTIVEEIRRGVIVSDQDNRQGKYQLIQEIFYAITEYRLEALRQAISESQQGTKENEEAQRLYHNAVMIKNARLVISEQLRALFGGLLDKDNDLNIIEGGPAIASSYYKVGENGEIVNTQTANMESSQNNTYHHDNPNQKSGFAAIADAHGMLNQPDGSKGMTPGLGCGQLHFQPAQRDLPSTVLQVQMPTMQHSVTPMLRRILTSGLAFSSIYLFNGYFEHLMDMAGYELGISDGLGSIALEIGIRSVMFFNYLKAYPKLENWFNQLSKDISARLNEFKPEKMRYDVHREDGCSIVEDFYTIFKVLSQDIITIYRMGGPNIMAPSEDSFSVQLTQQHRWGIGRLRDIYKLLLQEKEMSKRVVLYQECYDIFKEKLDGLKHFANTSSYPDLPKYFYQFSLVLAAYSALGITPFNFTGISADFFHHYGAIGLFASIGLLDYYLIKVKTIGNHQRNDIGFTRHLMQVAERRFVAIFASAQKDVDNLKGEEGGTTFITTEPALVPIAANSADKVLMEGQKTSDLSQQLSLWWERQKIKGPNTAFWTTFGWASMSAIMTTIVAKGNYEILGAIPLFLASYLTYKSQQSHYHNLVSNRYIDNKQAFENIDLNPNKNIDTLKKVAMWSSLIAGTTLVLTTIPSLVFVSPLLLFATMSYFNHYKGPRDLVDIGTITGSDDNQFRIDKANYDAAAPRNEGTP